MFVYNTVYCNGSDRESCSTPSAHDAEGLGLSKKGCIDRKDLARWQALSRNPEDTDKGIYCRAAGEEARRWELRAVSWPRCPDIVTQLTGDNI